MKHLVEPHSAWKLQTDHLWVNNLWDGEGPNELGDLLTNLHPKGQITGGEPDTLADTVGRKGPAMLVDIGSIVVGRLEEGRAGCLLLLQGKEWA